MTLGRPKVLITEEAIRARISELARKISGDYAHAEELLLVGILKGSFVFLADLSRRLAVPATVDFMALQTYGRESVPGEEVRLLMDTRSDISGKHVLVVEDIVDTGKTLRYLLPLLASRGPASLRTCAMLRKPARISGEVHIDYVGFDVPDVWVVGYGLDRADRYRALPYIGSVSP